MKFKYRGYPAVTEARQQVTGNFSTKCLTDEQREIASRFNVELEIVKAELQQLKAVLNKEPSAWLIPCIMMVTTSTVERDKWIKAGHEVVDLIRRN